MYLAKFTFCLFIPLVFLSSCFNFLDLDESVFSDGYIYDIKNNLNLIMDETVIITDSLTLSSYKHGYQEYIFTLNLPELVDSYTLYLQGISSAFKLFVNEKLILESGKVSSNYLVHQSNLSPRLVNMSLSGKTVLKFCISDYTTTLMGFRKPLYFSKSNLLIPFYLTSMSLIFICIGIILFVGFFCFFNFIFQRKSYEYFFLFISSILTSLRMLLDTFVYTALTDYMNPLLVESIQTLTTPLIAIFLSAYFLHFYSNKFNIYVIWGFVILSVLYIFSIFLSTLYSYILAPFYSIIMFIITAYIIFSAIVYIIKSHDRILYLHIISVIWIFFHIFTSFLNYYNINIIFPFQLSLALFYLTLVFFSGLEYSFVSYKYKFLLNASSHSLKTPLQTIVSTAEMAYEESDTDSVKKRLSLIQLATSHLLQITNRLLSDNFSMNKNKLYPSNIYDIINKIIEYLLQPYNIKYSLNVNPRVILTVDRINFYQIMIDIFSFSKDILLSNNFIIDFSFNDTFVILTIAVNGQLFTDVNKNNQHLRIKDPYIFTLKNTKQLVTSLGGSLKVVCKNNRTFFNLNYPYTKSDSKKNKRTFPTQNKNFKILLVDDTEIVRSTTSKIIERLGYVVETASSGEEALYFCKNNNIDLVLLDINLLPSGIDGFEVCKYIRSMSKINSVPIIFCSATHNQTVLNNCYISGGDDFIAKPFMQSSLLDKIDYWLRLSYVKYLCKELSIDFNKLNTNFIDLIFSYINDSKNYLSKIESSIHLNNFDDIRKFSHSLKGGAVFLNLVELKKSLSDIELNALEKSSHFNYFDSLSLVQHYFSFLELIIIFYIKPSL